MNEDIIKGLGPDFIIMLRRRQLQSLKHIKRYNHLRKLHSEIIDNMQDYLEAGKFDIEKNINPSKDAVEKFKKGKIKDKVFLNLSLNDPDDATVLLELIIYKQQEESTSLTEEYINKNRLRNEEKVKMLNAMNNSHASLFKIIDTDPNTGYVTYEDVFTGKKYQVIDIAMSTSVVVDKKNYNYMYNRLITYDDITFGTGIHCIMRETHPGLLEFIKKYKKEKKRNSGHMCLSLYQMSKKNNKVKVTYNHNY